MPELIDQDARRRAAADLSTTFLVEAGAGTGKTSLLVERFVSCLLKCGSVRRVVAITFTDKAAGELRLRVREQLSKLANDPRQPSERHDLLAGALREIDQAPISTIHSFAARLLKERPVEARIDPAFRQLDALGARLLLDRLWRDWLDILLGAPAEPVAGAPAQHPDASLVLGLLEAGVGLEALRTVAGQMFVARFDVQDAGAQPAWAGFSSLRASMGQKVEQLLAALQEQVEYASSCCLDQNDKGFAAAVSCAPQLQVLPAVLDGSIHQLATAVAATPLVSAAAGVQRNWGGAAGKEAFQSRCAVARELKAEIIDEYGCGVASAVLAAGSAFCTWAASEQLARGYLDFTDLLGRLRNALRDDLDLRAACQQAFDYLLVDEFQDTDPIQAEIVLLLSEEGPEAAGWRDVKPKPGKLFVVGDPKQSIYRFRRADIAMYDVVKQLITNTSGEVLHIRQNFRTLPSIIEWVNGCFQAVIGQDSAPRRQPEYVSVAAVRPEPGAGLSALGAPENEPAEAAIVAERTHEPLPRVLLLSGPPSEDQSADALRTAEAEGLATALVRGIDGQEWSVRAREVKQPDGSPEAWRPARWSDVTILLRASTGMQAYERALRKAGVPYRAEAGKAFYQRREVRDALLGLRAVADAADPLAVYGALHSTLFGFTDERLYLFHAAGGSFNYLHEQPPAAESAVVQALAVLRAVHTRVHEQRVDAVLADLLRRTWALEAAAAWGDGAGQAVRNLNQLLQSARAFAAEEDAALTTFVRWAEQQLTAAEEAESQPDEDADSVRIMTMHGAKGLEFPIVVVAGGCFAGRSADRTGVLLNRDQSRFEVAVKLTRVGGSRASSDKDSRAATGGHAALLEEEKKMEDSERRRLLYVATTRAMDLLVVTFPGWPQKGGGTSLLAPLADMLPEPGSVKAPEVRLGAVVVPASTGATVRAPAGKSPALHDALSARETWKAEEERLVAAAAKPPCITSPSRLEDVEFRQLEDEDERLAFAGGRRAALALGSAVHRVMERVPLQPAEVDGVPSPVAARLQELAAEAVAEFGFPGAEAPAGDEQTAGLVARVAVLAEACWSSAPVRLAAASAHVFRELPLCVQVAADEPGDEPTLIEGFCDLLYASPDGWVVVDYKTDKSADPETVRREYELQAGAYALAVQQVTGERVARACLVLAGAAEAGRPAPAVEVAVTADLLERVRRRARQAASESVPLGE